MQKWKKLGLIFNSNKESDWMYSHAMIPVAENIKDDIFRIYFSFLSFDKRKFNSS